MCNSGSGNGLRIALWTVISIIAGVAAGLLTGQHFMYARLVSWISVVVGIVVMVLIVLTAAVNGNRNFHKSSSAYLPAMSFGVFGLLAASILKLSLADMHTTIHAVILGFNIGFLCFVVGISMSFAISVHRHICHDNC